jgi:hypothetical protein
VFDMPGPLAIAAIGMGLQAVGNVVKTRSARRSIEENQQRRLAALAPAERQLETLNFGLTRSEDALVKGAVRSQVGNLARRNVLGGSSSQAEIDRVTAPYENAFAQRREGLAFRLAAAKEAIAADSQMPGYGEAFGSTLGDIGSFMAMRAGFGQVDGEGEYSKARSRLKDEYGIDLTESEFKTGFGAVSKALM